MNYRYLSEARKELDRQIGIYEEKDIGLGLEFLDEIESTISRVVELPNAWTEIENGIRRCLTNRFPFGLVYLPRSGSRDFNCGNYAYPSRTGVLEVSQVLV